jgi:V/A-type H+-transporting ATPase subunit G/H
MRGNDRPEERRKLEDSTAARLAEIVAAAEGAAKQVIDEAEAEAQRQLSDADAEAQRLVAERFARVAAVADRLAEGAEAIKRQTDELLAELRRAKQELGVESAAPAPGQTRLGEPSSTQTRLGEPPAPANGSGGEPASRKSHLTAVTFVEPEGDPPSAPAPPPAPVAESSAGSASAAAAPAPQERPAALAPEDFRTPAGARLLATQMAVSGSSRQEIEQKLRNGFEIEDTAPILDAILGPEAS